MTSLLQFKSAPTLFLHQQPLFGSLKSSQARPSLTGGGFRSVRCAVASPPNLKWRKPHRLSTGGTAKNPGKLAFCKYGIMVTEGGRISSQTIEAARRVLSRRIKGKGKMRIRVYATHPVTNRPAETRMGSGKGNVTGYVAICRAGKMLFELDGVSQAVAKEALTQAGYKIGIRTKFVDGTEKVSSSTTNTSSSSSPEVKNEASPGEEKNEVAPAEENN